MYLVRDMSDKESNKASGLFPFEEIMENNNVAKELAYKSKEINVSVENTTSMNANKNVNVIKKNSPGLFGSFKLPFSKSCDCSCPNDKGSAINTKVISNSHSLSNTVQKQNACIKLFGNVDQEPGYVSIYFKVGSDSVTSGGFSKIGLLKRLPKGLSKGLPKGLTKGLSKGLPKELTKGLPKELTEGLSKGLPKELTEGLSKGLPKELTKGLSKGLPKELTEGLTKGLPKELTEGLSKQLPKELTEGLSKRLPKELTEGLSKRLPKELTEGLSKRLPNALKDLDDEVVKTTNKVTNNDPEITDKPIDNNSKPIDNNNVNVNKNKNSTSNVNVEVNSNANIHSIDTNNKIVVDDRTFISLKVPKTQTDTKDNIPGSILSILDFLITSKGIEFKKIKTLDDMTKGLMTLFATNQPQSLYDIFQVCANTFGELKSVDGLKALCQGNNVIIFSKTNKNTNMNEWDILKILYNKGIKLNDKTYIGVDIFKEVLNTIKKECGEVQNVHLDKFNGYFLSNIKEFINQHCNNLDNIRIQERGKDIPRMNNIKTHLENGACNGIKNNNLSDVESFLVLFFNYYLNEITNKSFDGPLVISVLEQHFKTNLDLIRSKIKTDKNINLYVKPDTMKEFLSKFAGDEIVIVF